MGRFVKVAEDGDVQPGKVKGVRLDDRKIALFNEGGVVLAYEGTRSGIEIEIED